MDKATRRGRSEHSRPTLLKLKIWHPNCWTLKVTSAIDAGLIAHSVHKFDDLVNARVTAYGDRQEQVDRLITAIKSSSETVAVERIHNPFNPNYHIEGAGNATEELLVRYNPIHSILKSIISRGFLPDEEIRIFDGYEYWTVIVTTSRETMQERLDEVREEMEAEITVQSVQSPSMKSTGHQPKNRLTERQREIFEFARERGYYMWPREISATDLAEELNITKPTILEHLRKAESKLLNADI